MKLTLVVMAAGLGSRFGGPKQLARVGPSGETLLEYALFDAHRAGFTRCVVVARPELDKTLQFVTALLPGDLELFVVQQTLEDLPAAFKGVVREKPWGTAHAVLSSRASIEGPFVVVNADDFYGARAYELAARACAAAAVSGRGALIGMRLDATLSQYGPVVRGIPVLRGRQLAGLDEVRDIERTSRGIVSGKGRTFAGSEIASMNCWVFPRSVMANLAASFGRFLRDKGSDPSAEAPLPELINDLVQSGRLGIDVIEAPGPWFGLTYADDRATVTSGLRALVDEGVYPNPLWGNST
jgi:MobA-like NTP transferase protein